MPQKTRRDPSKITKQSYMMKGADINFVIALAKYLGVSQSEIIHILIDMARKEHGFISKMADKLEERVKKLRDLEKGEEIEEFEEDE